MNDEFAIRKILNNDIKFETNKLFLEITNKCNLHCKHCYNESNNGNICELSYNLIYQLMLYAKNHHINTVALSGGEALLHSEIQNIFETAEKNQLQIILLTNGTILDKRIMDILFKYKPILQISLDGSTEEINDYIRGKGSFKKTISFIKTLKENDYTSEISINTIMTNERLYDVIPMQNLASQLGVSYLSFGMLCSIGRADQNNMYLDKLNSNRIINTVNVLSDNKKVKTIAISHHCPLLDIENEVITIQSRITCDGTIFPCQMFHDEKYALGNLYKDTLEEILSGNRIKNFFTLLFLRKKNITQCNNCAFNKVCGKGCMAKAIIENGNPLTTDNLCQYYMKDFIKELHKQHANKKLN